MSTLGILPRNPFLYDELMGGVPWCAGVEPGEAVDYVGKLTARDRRRQHLSNYLEFKVGLPEELGPAHQGMLLTVIDPLLASRALDAMGASVCISSTGGVRVSHRIPPEAVRFHGSPCPSTRSNVFCNAAMTCSQVWGRRPYNVDTKEYDLTMMPLGASHLGNGLRGAINH